MDIQFDTHSSTAIAEELQYQRCLNQAVIATTAEALFMLDAQGRTTYVNPAAEQMFGWKQADLVGNILHDAIHCSRIPPYLYV